MFNESRIGFGLELAISEIAKSLSTTQNTLEKLFQKYLVVINFLIWLKT